jgi:hypothetical protein
MTTVYRILHVPTGMYFCPSREVRVKLSDGSIYQQNGCYVKSNLSKTGKAYIKKPSLKYVGSNYYTHLITSARQLNGRGVTACMLPVLESEWQIHPSVIADG